VKIVKKIFLQFALIFFAGTGTSLAHPFYVSICQMNYNEQNRSLEISVKIFADDLQAALMNRGISDLHLGETEEKPETDTFLSEYFKDHLSVLVDERLLEFHFIGKEPEDDAIWCYLEIQDVNTFSKIEVKNTILTEIFETQSNIVQVTFDGRTKNLLLKKGKTQGSLLF
jgi:hypothetical protein